MAKVQDLMEGLVRALACLTVEAVPVYEYTQAGQVLMRSETSIC